MHAFVDLIERDQLDIDSLIARHVPIQEVEVISACLKSKKNLGVVLSYMPHDETLTKEYSPVKEALCIEPVRFVPAIKDELRVGIVGASTFAMTQLMPIISRIKNVAIKAVVDTHAATSLNASRRYGAAQALSHDSELFRNNLVDVVVIASPHKFHGEHALRALEHGKAVFMAKPMVTDFNQFDRLMTFVRKHPEIPFCVDYNRSFSFLIQKIKKVTQKRKTPLAIHYRTNAGFIPKENRIQTNVGAGRIIGEACHIFDIFCYLTDSKPLAVSVEALHVGNTSLFPTDNVSVQISFADGSICSLLYTSLGHKDLGKERMEIFFDSKSIVMDDYDYLAGFGFPKSFDEVLSEPDKGYAVLLQHFFKYVKKEVATPPIDLERLATVARITLIADQLACNGGGSSDL
jgi:predicted dehydrogenase